MGGAERFDETGRRFAVACLVAGGDRTRDCGIPSRRPIRQRVQPRLARAMCVDMTSAEVVCLRLDQPQRTERSAFGAATDPTFRRCDGSVEIVAFQSMRRGAPSETRVMG